MESRRATEILMETVKIILQTSVSVSCCAPSRNTLRFILYSFRIFL